MDQMNLAQIGLKRIPAHLRAMLDGLSHMRIALDSQAGEELDALYRRLAECVRWAAAHSYYDSSQ